MLWGKIEKNKKAVSRRESSPGHWLEPPVLCHWAMTAMQTTTDPHNPLCELRRWYWMPQSQSTSIECLCGTPGSWQVWNWSCQVCDWGIKMDRWTRQLLRRSALLPRPSTLKLNSLPLALTSISLPCAHPPSHQQWGHALWHRKGGCIGKRKCCILHISPLCVLYWLRLKKRGRWCIYKPQTLHACRNYNHFGTWVLLSSWINWMILRSIYANKHSLKSYVLVQLWR